QNQMAPRFQPNLFFARPLESYPCGPGFQNKVRVGRHRTLQTADYADGALPSKKSSSQLREGLYFNCINTWRNDGRNASHSSTPICKNDQAGSCAARVNRKTFGCGCSGSQSLQSETLALRGLDRKRASQIGRRHG